MLSNARLKKVICLQVQCYVYDRDGKLHDLSPLAKQSGAYKVTSNFYINVCQDIIPGICIVLYFINLKLYSLSVYIYIGNRIQRLVRNITLP